MSPALKAVHACRRQVPGLAEDDLWRTWLENLTGKRSLREMSDRELSDVIEALRRNGAKANGHPSSKPHIRKVFAVWKELCLAGIPHTPNRHGLRAFVERMTSVDDPNWLTADQARVVIEALKGWLFRERRKKGVAAADVQT